MKWFKAHFVWTVVVLFSVLSTTSFGVAYVDDSAPGPVHDGASWATAFLYLQDALAADTEIRVAQGTYRPDQGAGYTLDNRYHSFNLLSSRSVYGGYAGYGASDPDERKWRKYETTLTGEIGTAFDVSDNSYHVCTGNGLLDGFTITRGNADGTFGSHDRGGGVKSVGGTIRNCRFYDNEADFGGGLCGEEPYVINCTFESNSAIEGDDVASYDGGVIGEEIILINSVFTNQVYMWNTGGTVINCTFGGNLGELYVECDEYQTSGNPQLNVYVYNSIFWSGSFDPITLRVDGNSRIDLWLYYNDIKFGTSGITKAGSDPDNAYDHWEAGNISSDPVYANGRRLGSGSPCIDAGSNDLVPPDTTDLDGDGNTSEKIPMDQDGQVRFFDDPAVSDTGQGTAPLVDMGAYERTGIIYVDLAATGADNGSNWHDAYTSLHDGIDVAVSGDQIWVAKGNYPTTAGGGYAWNDRNARYELKSGVAIYGGFLGTEAQLEQRDWNLHETRLTGGIALVGISDDSYHVVRAMTVGPSTQLDGFTVSYGNASGTGNEDKGGGLYTNSSPTIANCRFENNRAIYGGGIYHGNVDFGGPQIINCQFIDNLGSHTGGAIYTYNNDSTPLIANCLFRNNTANVYGGGIYSYDCSPEIVNCSFSSNTGTNFGGALDQVGTGTATVRNSVFWGNSSAQGHEIATAGTSIVDIQYSTVQGGLAEIDVLNTASVNWGSGAVSVNPNFADADLHLATGSPCIDAGNNAAVPGGITTDIDGNVRFADDPSVLDTGSGTAPIVDMGPYENIFSHTPTTIYVDHTAVGSNNGTSWANAFVQLRDGITASLPGDEVHAAQGTHKPDSGSDRTASFTIMNGTTLYGGFPSGGSTMGGRDPDSYPTVLSGDIGTGGSATDNSYHVVTLDIASLPVILDGFTVQDGNANGSSLDDYGGGMYLANCEDVIIRNCKVSDNSAQVLGGGIYGYICADLMIENSIFENNSTVITNSKGGGVYNSSGDTLSLLKCSFLGNYSYMGGGVYNYYTEGVVTNCLFSGNTSYAGGAMFNFNNLYTITNSTFCQNDATSWSGGLYFNNCSASSTMDNCIVWGNTAPASPQIRVRFNSLAIDFCDIEGGQGDIELQNSATLTWGAGNITVDPLFIDSDGGDNTVGTLDDNLHLGFGSPCIDAGNNTAVPPAATTDLDNNMRFVDDPYTTDTGSGTPPIVDMGAYEVQEIIYGDIVYVDESATGSNDGTSWTDAFLNLQDALTVAVGTPSQVWVAEGSYYPDQDMSNPTGSGDRNATFQLINGVAVYGGFPSSGGDWASRDPQVNVTVLEGNINVSGDATDNSYHIVTGSGTDETAIINGFTIQNGYYIAGSGAGIVNIEGSPTLSHLVLQYNQALNGGGLFNIRSNPLIEDCRFYQNSTGPTSNAGGGMYNNESIPVIRRCQFIDNWAYWGGGAIYNHAGSHAIIENCIFYLNSNTSTGTNFGGGAIHNSSMTSPSVVHTYPVITCCTFYQNTSNGSGGGIFSRWGSAPILTNCILWDNSDSGPQDFSAQIYDYSGSNTIPNYCDVQGWTVGMGGLGNIAVDPQFFSPASQDFHLKSEGWRWDQASQSWDYDGTSSRCLDAGSPGYDCDIESSQVPASYGENIRINMGAYGGTWEASKPLLDWVRLSDINNDGISNLPDFSELSAEWMLSEDNLPCDFDRDGSIGLDDLALMAQDFLNPTTWH